MWEGFEEIGNVEEEWKANKLLGYFWYDPDNDTEACIENALSWDEVKEKMNMGMLVVKEKNIPARLNVGVVLNLGDYVDISDPCYDKNEGLRLTVPVVVGEYLGSVCRIFTEGAYSENDNIIFPNLYSDSRISEIDICHRDYYGENDILWEKVGNISVDAGLAGFFNNKPNYNDEEWNAFCNKLDFKNDKLLSNVYKRDNAFFSASGFGDGIYDVYGKKVNDKYVALKIIFIYD